jgi:TonB family protein
MIPQAGRAETWLLFLMVAALITGCASPGTPVESPVNNPTPALKPGVYTVKTVDTAPVSIHEVYPDFPRELGSIPEGKALVVFTVRADGKVAEASVVQADDVLFGEEAVRAVLKWRFQPAQLAGKPVDCRMTLPFIFDSPYGIDEGGVMADPMPSRPPGATSGTIEAH